MAALARHVPGLRRFARASILAIGLPLAFAAPISAQATSPPGTTRAAAATVHVNVHVIARDAKLIGSSVGGATVTITDVATGRVLARGPHQGGTGDTRRIMVEPHVRGAPLFDTPGAAGFVAEIAIPEPTVVEIAATGPGNPADAATRASKTLLLIPGHDITGDGVVLELHGFRVEFLDETPGRATPGTPFPAAVRVTMMCGCPTEPGGMWNADAFEILARLLDGDRVIAQAPLTFTGTTSQYRGSLTPPEAGTFLLEILAVDTGTANAGRARREIVVR